MLILGIDTSTSAIAVGLSDGGERVESLARVDPRGHTEHLAPLVAALLSSSGVGVGSLTGIVVGTGPGPFTGLRVGMVTGVTMGHALGIPVHGVCSLDVLAHQAFASEVLGMARVAGSGGVSGMGDAAGGTGDAGDVVGSRVAVATDARRREVYWATYVVQDGRVTRESGPAVDRPAEVPAELRALPTAGRGPGVNPELYPAAVEPLDVDAGVLAQLGARGVAAGRELPVEPLYLRRPDALTTAERARA